MTMAELAENTGSKDLFVLQRVAEDRFFNLDGHGRGAGWAGNVSVDPANEPWISEVLRQGIHSKRSGVPFRAFGPYWTNEVAGVAHADHVVVFGGEKVSTSEDDLRQAATAAVSLAGEVRADKREADEAEVQQAIDELVAVKASSAPEAARHLASTTARALSCEFGAVLLSGPPVRVHLADEGWRPAAGDEEVIAALLPLQQVAKEGIFVEQDLSATAFPYRPLSFDDGLVARCAVPLGPGGELGLLVAAHAGSAARGFTSLCQRVAQAMGETGASLLEDLTKPEQKPD